MNWKQKMQLASWAVFLTLLLLGGVHIYTRLQLGNAAFQQLLIEKNQMNVLRQRQIEEQNRLSGRQPQTSIVPQQPQEEPPSSK